MCVGPKPGAGSGFFFEYVPGGGVAVGGWVAVGACVVGALVVGAAVVGAAVVGAAVVGAAVGATQATPEQMGRRAYTIPLGMPAPRADHAAPSQDAMRA